MQKHNMSARDRIRLAADELLSQVSDAEKITVRQIADRANVGVGLVNYHFGSKDGLLASLVAEKMANMVRGMQTAADAELLPKQRLQLMLTRLFDYSVEYLPLVRFMVRQNIEDGEMGSALTLVPFLKDIFGSDADEMRLRVIALQILYPIQITGLVPEKFKLFSGIDIMNTEERSEFVSQLINNIM